jgi:hypothetical protein
MFYPSLHPAIPTKMSTIIMRHGPLKRGFFWTAYIFAGGSSNRDLQHPNISVAIEWWTASTA